MTDRELLELAAKAAGLDDAEYRDIRGWGEVRYGQSEAMWSGKRYEECGSGYWNPLADDGDALRLASDLSLCCQFTAYYSVCYAGSPMAKQFTEKSAGNRHEATRRAITRAAAEIGKAMP